MELAYRHVQHRLVGVFEVQEFLRFGLPVFAHIAEIEVHQTQIAPDSVGAVHHRVTQIEFAQIADQRLDIADLFLRPSPACHGAGGEQLGFGDEVDTLRQPAKTVHQASGSKPDFFGAVQELLQRVEAHRIQGAGAHKVEQAFTASGAFGQYQHAVDRVGQVVLEARQRVFGSAHHRQCRQDGDFHKRGFAFCQGRAGQVLRLSDWQSVVWSFDRRSAYGVWFNRELRITIRPAVKLLGRQKQCLRRQRGPFGVALDQTVTLFRILPEMREGRFQIAVQHKGGVVAQIVENGRGFVKEKWQVILDTGSSHAGAYVLVDAALGWVAFEQFTPAAAKPRARVVVHRKFTPRQ